MIQQHFLEKGCLEILDVCSFYFLAVIALQNQRNADFSPGEFLKMLMSAHDLRLNQSISVISK